MDLDELARQMGTTVDSLPGDLDTLFADVSADQPINDDHPRFGEHVAMIGWAARTWPDVEAMCDEAVLAKDGHAGLNAVTRAIIEKIKLEL